VLSPNKVVVLESAAGNLIFVDTNVEYNFEIAQAMKGSHRIEQFVSRRMSEIEVVLTSTEVKYVDEQSRHTSLLR
jgi:hypothetical protein